MQRFWLLLGALGAADLLFAAALAFIMSQPGVNQTLALQPSFQPFFTIPREPARAEARLEQRVRNIMRREFQQLVGLGGTPGPAVPAVPIGAISQRERVGVSGPQLRERPPVDRGEQQPRRARESTAVLTPFGLYQGGPTGVGLALLSLSTLLGLGGITVYLLPHRLRVLRDTVTTPWRHLLQVGVIGLLGYLVSFLLLFILVMLVVGIPFALLLLLALVAASFLGLVAVSLALGRWLKSKLVISVASPLADLALGMLLVFPLGLVPLLGWALMLAVAAVGLGAILLTKVGSENGWSLAPLTGDDGAPLS